MRVTATASRHSPSPRLIFGWTWAFCWAVLGGAGLRTLGTDSAHPRPAIFLFPPLSKCNRLWEKGGMT